MNKVGDKVKLLTPEYEVIYGVIVKIKGDRFWVWSEFGELFENLKQTDFV